MEHAPRFVSNDWVSRVGVAISLIANVCLAAYIYNQHKSSAPDLTNAINTALENRESSSKETRRAEIESVVDTALTEETDAIVSSVQGKLTTMIEDEVKNGIDDRIFALNEDLKEANDNLKVGLTNFETRGNQTLRDLDELYLSQRKRFDELDVDRILASKITTTDSSGSDSSGTDSTDLGKEDLVTHVTMKPVGANGRTVRIANDGASRSNITRIVFSPKRDFLKTVDADEDLVAFDSTTIVFDESHNTATESGAHADYVYIPQKAIEVDPSKAVFLRFDIKNRLHSDYGFEGDLKIEFDDNRSVDASLVRVHFRR